MRRVTSKRSTEPSTEEEGRELPQNTSTIHHVIHPQAVYSLEAARAALGLARATLKREIKLGRLRVAKRAGRYFLLGSWLLEWLRDGEIRRRRVASCRPGQPRVDDLIESCFRSLPQ